MSNALDVLTAEEQREIDFAQAQIDRFAYRHEYGEEILQLAKYAAFATAVTPNLLFYLRENSDVFQDEILKEVPWYGAADLLLSSLCQRIGNDLYEMSGPLRMLLLQELRDEEDGEQRIRDLSEFMTDYIAMNLESSADRSELVGGFAEWIEFAYLQPGELLEKIRADLLSRLKNRQEGDKFYWSALLESLAAMLPGEPLLQSQLQNWADEVADGNFTGFGRGEDRSAWAEAHQIQLEWQQVTVAKIRISDLDSRDPNALQKFTFEVAKVDSSGEEILPRQQKEGKFFIELLGETSDLKAPYLEMVAIPGGQFLMGFSQGEGRDYEKPQHPVTVRPFYMAKYPVTQAQWRAVAAMDKFKDSLDLKSSPSRFPRNDSDDRDSLPVEQVFWLEAQEFCQRVTKMAARQVDGTQWECRLPTEAEWEYACRAGTTTPFHFGETISTQLANYDGNYAYGQGQKGKYQQQTTPVGSFGVANDFGLYDMHGNVWEWCEDDWHDNYKNASEDGFAWLDVEGESSGFKILRGGSWDDYPNYCRSACRSRLNADVLNCNIGFRVVYAPARTL